MQLKIVTSYLTESLKLYYLIQNGDGGCTVCFTRQDDTGTTHCLVSVCCSVNCLTLTAAAHRESPMPSQSSPYRCQYMPLFTHSHNSTIGAVPSYVGTAPNAYSIESLIPSRTGNLQHLRAGSSRRLGRPPNAAQRCHRRHVGVGSSLELLMSTCISTPLYLCTTRLPLGHNAAALSSIPLPFTHNAATTGAQRGCSEVYAMGL